MKACEVIVKERTKQLDDCKRELREMLEKALQLQRDIGKTDEETYFQEYVRVTRDEGVGDKEATAVALDLLKSAGIEGPLASLTNKPLDGRKGDKGKKKRLGCFKGLKGYDLGPPRADSRYPAPNEGDDWARSFAPLLHRRP